MSKRRSNVNEALLCTKEQLCHVSICLMPGGSCRQGVIWLGCVIAFKNDEGMQGTELEELVHFFTCRQLASKQSSVHRPHKMQLIPGVSYPLVTAGD